MERRLLLKLIAAGVVARPAVASGQSLVSLAAAPAAAVAYSPQVFTVPELELLADLCETIIPAGEASPGARDALVERYIDVIVSEQDEPSQRTWKSGLAAVQDEARARFGRAFLELSSAEKDDIVAAMAEAENDPHSALEEFFVSLKRAAIDGYYTSEAAVQSMGYKGNAAVSEFPGCTHTEHKV